jgi:hypothetical protein
MAEQSKFAGALGRLKRPGPSVAEVQSEVKATPRSRAMAEPAAPAGGRGGKRSDPAYSPTTFFVRKETKRNATRLLLEDVHAGKDLSDLVEELLAKWVSTNSNA